LWNDWRSALLLVKPETVIARGFDCIGIGRFAILKDDRVYLQKFGI
jgi:hypothetical protein